MIFISLLLLHPAVGFVIPAVAVVHHPAVHTGVKWFAEKAVIGFKVKVVAGFAGYVGFDLFWIGLGFVSHFYLVSIRLVEIIIT